MTNPVYIFSQPIRSGKTSTLMNWVSTKKNVLGVLAPDLDGFRYILTLNNREFHRFQIPSLYDNKSSEVISIGRFSFLAETFQIAQKAIKAAWSKSEWLIIDEVGKLEVKDQGLEPIVSQTIAHYKYHSTAGKLLLVVREDLLDEVLSKYGITNFRMVTQQFFDN